MSKIVSHKIMQVGEHKVVSIHFESGMRKTYWLINDSFSPKPSKAVADYLKSLMVNIEK